MDGCFVNHRDIRMRTPRVGLGMNQEKYVGDREGQRAMKWLADRQEPGFLELSEEAEREFASAALASEIDRGKARKRERWQMVEEAGRLLPNEAVCSCCQEIIPTPTGQGVAVYRSKDSGSAFFLGVKPCGSVWMCAICAAKITERRRQELRTGLQAWLAMGRKVFLLTLTIPHHSRRDTCFWCDQLLKAYRLMQNRTFWRNWTKNIGLVGTVRALEVTYGDNGAHVHIHVLLFCVDDKQVPTASDLLFSWQSCCVSKGKDKVALEKPNECGVDIRDGTYAASYVGKWGMDYELTKSHVKRGKESGRTPWDLLRASIKGDTAAGLLFQEYANAFKGRRQLCWSRGLRQFLGLDEQGKTDQELAEEHTEVGELITTIAPDDWKRVLKHRARASVLIVAERSGSVGVTRLLHHFTIKDG